MSQVHQCIRETDVIGGGGLAGSLVAVALSVVLSCAQLCSLHAGDCAAYDLITCIVGPVARGWVIVRCLLTSACVS
jgi:hypothetical protein